MFVLVLAAEADETRQAITFLIVCLVGIAFLLSVLTAWYWSFTSPKKRAKVLLRSLGHFEASDSDSPLAAERLMVDDQAARVSMLAESAEAMRLASAAVPAVTAGPAPDPVIVPAVARETAPDKVVAAVSVAAPVHVVEPVHAAGPTEAGARASEPVAGSMRIEVVDRAPRPMGGPGGSSSGPSPRDDELAEARRRRERQARDRDRDNGCDRTSQAREPVRSGAEGALSDDDWAAIMRSAFEQLNQ